MVACRGTPFRVRGGSWDGSSSMGDCRKCQTSTASPAKPGGLPVMLAAHLAWRSRAALGRNVALLKAVKLRHVAEQISLFQRTQTA